MNNNVIATYALSGTLQYLSPANQNKQNYPGYDRERGQTENHINNGPSAKL